MSTQPPATVDDDNPFTFTTEIIILIAVAVGLLLILIICCCCIVKKRREKTIEVTPSAIREGKVTPSQLLDAGMSPQSVVEIGAATPSQLVEEGLARPDEVKLNKKQPPPIAQPYVPPYAYYPPPARVAAPEELLKAGYTPSQLSTYSVIHRNKEEKGKKKLVGSDETFKVKDSKSPKKVVVVPSQGTIYTGPIKRTVKDDNTEVENYTLDKSDKKKTNVTNENNTFSTWMSPNKPSKSKALGASTVPSNYQHLDKKKTPGRVVVVESNVSRKGSMATDVNVNKESKMSQVSKVKTQSPSMKTQGKSSKAKFSKAKSSSKSPTSSSKSNKKGSSKYDVDD